MQIKDLMGKRFGRLVVIDRELVMYGEKTRWICQCDCGNKAFVDSYGLTSGRAKSCGCLSLEKMKKSKTKHGLSGTKLFKTWCHMKTRCNNPRHEHYERYGGRGIRVCEEWEKDFKAFQGWALNNGYIEGLTIDRKDTDGNYEPSNCQWSTQTEQVRNRTNTIFVDYQGKKISLGELAEILGMNYKTLHAKYKRKEQIAVGITYNDLYLNKK